MGATLLDLPVRGTQSLTLWHDIYMRRTHVKRNRTGSPGADPHPERTIRLCVPRLRRPCSHRRRASTNAPIPKPSPCMPRMLAARPGRRAACWPRSYRTMAWPHCCTSAARSTAGPWRCRSCTARRAAHDPANAPATTASAPRPAHDGFRRCCMHTSGSRSGIDPIAGTHMSFLRAAPPSERDLRTSRRGRLLPSSLPTAHAAQGQPTQRPSHTPALRVRRF